MRRVLISVLTVALVLGAMGGAAAAASSQASRDSSHSRNFTLSGTPDAFQNFSTTQCCEANPGDYIVEHVNLTTSGGQAVG
ncbi:MAG: hypothetical protein M3N98_09330, partial [Actinomycetota bacterium]|nr:hypothetical protein [Actinomycetota bacterium]